MTLTNGIGSFQKMTDSLTPFIPAADLLPLVRGSHQEITHRLAEALQLDLGRFGNQAVQLLATFDGHVTVLSEAGDVFKVQYSALPDGTVELQGQELVPVQVVTERNIRSYVQREAKEAAALFMKGLVDQANARITAIAPLVDSITKTTDDDTVQAFRESRQVTPEWRKTLETRKDSIQEYLGESIQAEPMKARFSSLYDGTMAADDVAAQYGLVQGDMRHLIKRLAAVEAQTQDSLARIQAIQGDKTNSLTDILAFAENLLSDVAQVKQFAEDAVQDFDRTDLMAKVFDSMVAEVSSFEVAGSFAAKVAMRLA